MDELDLQIEATRKELEALRQVPEETSWYSPKQLAFDVGAGVAKAGAGLVDIAGLPPVFLARQLGAPVEYFGTSKLLSKALDPVAEAIAVNPESTAQEVVSFVTPSPFSKAKLLSQAGQGLASYFGMKAGEAVAPDSYGGLIGALAAPAGITGARKVITKAAPAVSQTTGLLLGKEEALQKAANEAVLRAAGTEGAQRITDAVGPGMTYGAGGLPLTAAEIAQTPSMALAQKAVQLTPEGASVLTPAIEERGQAIASALGDIGIAPQQGDMSTAMRDAAAKAAEQKLTEQESILSSLGFTPEVRAETPLQRGSALLDSLQSGKREANDTARKAWKEVPGETLLNVKAPFAEALSSFKAFGKHAKADTSKATKRIMRDVRNVLRNQDGITTVDELQDIRAAAGRAYKEASGINPTQQSLMASLRDAIDNAGISYLYDQKAGVRGGLPGTAATATDLEALTKLSGAIESTRTKYKTFGEGIVGDLLKVRKGNLVTKASDAVNKVLSKAENIDELINKFGKDSNEFLAIRPQLLSKLEKASDPVKFIEKHQDVFNKVFDSDLEAVNKYARLVNSDAPLANYAEITDAVIPRKIFADSRSANAFVKEFEGTLIHDFAKSKFVSEQLLKRGDPLEALSKNKTIAQTVLGKDYASVETLLKDRAIYNSPTKLASLATKGQSWTHQLNTAFGAMMSARGLVGFLKRGMGAGGISGGALGIALGGPIGALATTVGGSIAGYGLERLGKLRESQLNALEAKIMANPKLLQLATAPATSQNIKTLSDTLNEMGFLGAKATIQGKQTSELEDVIATQPAQQSAPQEIDIDAEIESARRELEALRGNPVKQDISFLIDDAAQRHGVNPKLIKAVVHTESSGKPDAVSPKGAQGYMQLMPNTAKALGVTDPFDPAQNIEGGVKYLAQLIKKFGDEKLALAAYNWGEGNIRKQLDRLERRNKPQTLAAILKYGSLPTETENYIRKISRLTEEA